jgi:serine/threonine-protein kinase
MRVLEKGAQLADRYTLVRRLGSGGMSEIWLAQDRRTEKSVALKFLLPGMADNAGYRKLLRNEWQLGSRLMHANIVRVFEYHDADEGPYYSLQYIGGPDIAVLAHTAANRTDCRCPALCPWEERHSPGHKGG